MEIVMAKEINILSSQTITQRGYNLLQMAIALLVAGIILGTLIQGYDLYQKQEKIRISEENLKTAITELQKFKQLNGRYPCPASLTATRDDDDYGLPTNCEDLAPMGTTPVAGGTWGTGIGIQAGLRDVNPDPAITDTPRVRYGAIPFRLLNLDEKQAYDAFGSRYFYVMTERMANQLTMNERQGAIGIYDENGQNILGRSSGTGASESNLDSGVFAVFSPGADRKGGYDEWGNIAVACVAGDLDSGNCSFGPTARYTYTQKRLAKGATPQYFDDEMGFFSELPDKPWAASSDDPNNIVDVSPAGIGIATNTPQTELDIRNSWSMESEVTQKLPQGTLRASEKVLADKICPSNAVGTDKDCFNVVNIAGDASQNPGTPENPGNGMKCPDGEFMSGIKNGAPICVKGSVGCNGKYQMLAGFRNGEPICKDKPCGTMAITQCAQTKTLPMTTANQSVTLSFGTGKSVKYQCRSDGSGVVAWQLLEEIGDCTCAPSTRVESNFPCGTGYTGTYTRKVTTTCPNNVTTYQGVDWAQRCPQTCVGLPDRQSSYNCPQYQGNGKVIVTQRFTCATGSWATISTDRSQCVCQAQPDKRNKLSDCNDGYLGTGMWQNQTFNMGTCSYAAAGPIESDCKCNSAETRTLYEDPNCENYQDVQEKTVVTQKRDGPNCSWGSKVVTKQGVCKVKDLRWRLDSYGSGAARRDQMGPLVGDTCAPADFVKGNTTTCSQRTGSMYQISSCRCKP